MTNKTYRPTHRFRYLIQKDFQLKYTGYMVVSALMSAIIVGGPVYYFLNQNYDIFLDLAYNISPDIVQNLDQEKTWITGFFALSLTTLLIFHIYFGIRLTFRIVGPLTALKKHIGLVTKGHLYQKPLFIRGDDEFHDLIKNYNYLYKTLRAQNSFDIKKLEGIRYSIKDPKVLEALDQMISEKESQIHDPNVSEKTDQAHIAS